jgi:hypothetical protein
MNNDDNHTVGIEDSRLNLEDEGFSGKYPTEPKDLRFRHEGILRSTSATISLSCYISVVLVLFAAFVASAVFVLSTTIQPDKKAFIATVLSAGTVGILIILCLARKHPTTLLIFIPTATFIGGILTGVAVSNV